MGKWVKKKLGEGLVDRICTGKLDANAMVDGGLYRFYTCAKDYTYIDDYAFDDEALLISGNGEYVGYVHYYRGKFNAYQRTYVLRGFSIDVKYLQSYLNCFLRDRIKKEMNAGSIPFIKMGTLTDMYISYPSSLSEQRRIASILSSADKVIDSTQKLIAKYKSIKQGMMEDLLKPKEGWKKVKLGEVGKISMCKRVFSFETSIEGEIPFYKIGTFGKTADAFITRQLFEEYKNKFSYPKVGDILISASGTIGRTVVYDGEPAYFQDSNIIWIDNDETIILNQFLYYQYKIISWNLEGSTIARLYNDNFNKIEIFVPDFSEQRRIASILSSIDKKIESEEKVLEKYKNIKKGLMEKLLNCE